KASAHAAHPKRRVRRAKQRADQIPALRPAANATFASSHHKISTWRGLPSLQSRESSRLFRPPAQLNTFKKSLTSRILLRILHLNTFKYGYDPTKEPQQSRRHPLPHPERRSRS